MASLVSRSPSTASSSTSTLASPSQSCTGTCGSKPPISLPGTDLKQLTIPLACSCNSTGVYAGVIGDGNGNADDTSNLNRTFFRGIAKTDDDGVATFKSAFPGHYSGRATHIHVVTHAGATQLANGTLTGGNVTHIGQLFFDQDLIEDINTNVAPYNTNTIEIVDNADDRVFATETENESDPVFNYVKLSDDVEDGLFAWLAIGVDLSASYEASYAAVYGENGGTEA